MVAVLSVTAVTLFLCSLFKQTACHLLSTRRGFPYLPALLFGLIIYLPGIAHAAPAAVPNQYIVKLSSGTKSSPQMLYATLGVEILKYNPVTGSQLVRTTRGKSFNHHYAKNLLAQGLAEYIEPNYIVSIHGTVPNDNRFSELWGMNNSGQGGGTSDVDIDAPEAWGLTTGSNSVVVGVVDTGVLYTHPDLAQNIWVNPNEIADNGVDDDGNGVVDDVHGYSALDHSGEVLDDNGHGTHCAGSIGAVGDNGRGVAGVNWQVRIMALKFLDASGFGTTAGAISAIEYAVRMKRSGVNLTVLSNSWGGGGFSQALRDAISEAEAAGILFVAAAGNSANDNDVEPTYPASYDLPNIVSVAAVDSHGNLASFSNYGSQGVDLAAPGVSILSTHLDDGYQTMSGTSMAAPHVSGVAALVLGRESNLSTAALKSRLIATVKPLDSLAGLVRAPGMVNAHNALVDARTPLPPPVPTVKYQSDTISFDYQSELGERVLAVDDGYIVVDLGFAFPYYGETFSRLAISANGRVVPLAEGESPPDSADYSNSLSRGIHPYHDDLYPSPHTSDKGGVWFFSDSNTATVTWIAVNYTHRNSSDAQREIRVQLRLSSNGVIEFHYPDTLCGDQRFDHGASATVGLSPVAGTSGEKLLVSHNTANPGLIGDNLALRFRVQRSAARSDFDGDGKSDLVVWRPDTGYWYILFSGAEFDFSMHHGYQLGLPGDVPVVGDYDGDGIADLAVWRPADGTWYFRMSSSGYSVITSIQWGLAGDEPLSGDFDGDGRTDLAVYRPSAGIYFVLLSSSEFNRSAALSGSPQSMVAVKIGGLGHDVVVGDFTGDGKDDFGAVWQVIRFWSVKDSSGNLLYSLPWGEPGDTPIVCDWDGDGVSDRFMVRVSSGHNLEWYGAQADGAVSVSSFGSLGDIPRCDTDYDGDGKGDQTVFRPQTGEWFIRYSGTGEVVKHSFGLLGDIAL